MSKFKKIIRQNRLGVFIVIILAGIFVFSKFGHNVFSGSESGSVVTVVSSNSDHVHIPSLNIEVPIIYSAAVREADISVELESGAVHLNHTAMAGEVGNVFIIGRSSNRKNAPGNFNEVFKELPNIKVGDEIVLELEKKDYKYVVYDTKVVLPTELWVMSQETGGEKILTLQTSYPVGSTKQRFVAIAKLKR